MHTLVETHGVGDLGRTPGGGAAADEIANSCWRPMFAASAWKAAAQMAPWHAGAVALLRISTTMGIKRIMLIQGHVPHTLHTTHSKLRSPMHISAVH